MCTGEFYKLYWLFLIFVYFAQFWHSIYSGTFIHMRLRAHLDKMSINICEIWSIAAVHLSFSFFCNMAPRQFVIIARRFTHRCALETSDSDVWSVRQLSPGDAIPCPRRTKTSLNIYPGEGQGDKKICKYVIQLQEEMYAHFVLNFIIITHDKSLPLISLSSLSGKAHPRVVVRD
jgi:hypothetical protein